MLLPDTNYHECTLSLLISEKKKDINYLKLATSFYQNKFGKTLMKLKLEYLKSGFKCKKRRHKYRRTFFLQFASLEFDFFRVQL